MTQTIRNTFKKELKSDGFVRRAAEKSSGFPGEGAGVFGSHQ